MITLKPIRDDLVEYEQTLGMQEYWDDLGSYWSDSKLEKKIAMLAEQYKNDPVKIALLNKVAKELAILEKQ